MSLNKQSHASSQVKVAPDPEGSLAAVTQRLADCIRVVVPHSVAIFVPGKTPYSYSTVNFPAEPLAQIRNRFETNWQLVPGRMHASDRLADPHRFSDGSCAFLLPLVHNGALEAMLCLYDSGNRDQALLHQHLVSLEPICQLAAIFISSARETVADAQTAQSLPADIPNGDPRAMVQFASELLRRVSHDIRTPITAVRGCAKMMLDGRAGPISDAQRECLRMALNGVDQLIGLATSISGASSLISEIRPEILDVRELWQTVLKSSRPQLIARAVTIEESIESGRAAICGDRQILARVFERLLDCVLRAVEYHGRLHVELRCRNDMTLLLTLPGTISLQGVEEDLASVRETVFLHGGQLSIRPGSEGGLILTLTLPGYYQ